MTFTNFGEVKIVWKVKFTQWAKIVLIVKFIATELQQSMSGRKVIIGTKGFLKTEKEQNKLILTQRVSTQWKKKKFWNDITEGK